MVYFFTYSSYLFIQVVLFIQFVLLTQAVLFIQSKIQIPIQLVYHDIEETSQQVNDIAETRHQIHSLFLFFNVFVFFVDTFTISECLDLDSFQKFTILHGLINIVNYAS